MSTTAKRMARRSVHSGVCSVREMVNVNWSHVPYLQEAGAPPTCGGVHVVRAHLGRRRPAVERVGHHDEFLVGDVAHMYDAAEQEGLALFQSPADGRDGLEVDFGVACQRGGGEGIRNMISATSRGTASAKAVTRLCWSVTSRSRHSGQRARDYLVVASAFVLVDPLSLSVTTTLRGKLYMNYLTHSITNST